MENPFSPEKICSLFETDEGNPFHIINRESSTIEFKESYSHANMAMYFKTMAAFANNDGGYIIFGVKDNPRMLAGLENKKLENFENLKVEIFTKNLLEHFSPEIKWEHQTFKYQGLSFGIIYTYPLENKPCICKKNADNSNPKYALKESDIYYRYGGSTERIRYGELHKIIEERRKNEEKLWLNLLGRIAHIGVSNAALLDLKSGALSGNSGEVIIDEECLKKISFIQEGKFVETGGSPTLRIIGDITTSGRVIIKEKAVVPDQNIKAFLSQVTVKEPFEYIKIICSANSANYPIYYFLKQANISIEDAISSLKNVEGRGAKRNDLIKRLEGKKVKPSHIPSQSTAKSTKITLECYAGWLSNNLQDDSGIKYSVRSFMYLTDEQIMEHKEYIFNKLYSLFLTEYGKAETNSIDASELRKAICRLDEVLYGR